MAMWGRTIEGLQNPKSVPLGTDRTRRFGREEKQMSFYSTTGNLVQAGGLDLCLSSDFARHYRETVISIII